MRIKRYKQFLEKMGVPDNIINSSEQLYSFIIKELEKVEFNNPIGNYIELDKQSDIIIGDSIFEITIIMNFDNDDNLSSPIELSEVIITSESEVVEDLGVRHEDGYLLNIKLQSVIGASYIDLLKFMKNNRIVLLRSLSHELKHMYDFFKKGKVLLSNIALYDSSMLSSPIEILDYFIYLLYFTQNIENSVRTTEIASMIKSRDISKSEFSIFLKGTDIYTTLRNCKNFTYEKLRKIIKNDISEVREIIGGINLKDDTIINIALSTMARNIANKRIERFDELIELSEQVNNSIRELNSESISKFNKKYKYNDYESFYRSCEKQFHISANKVLRNISKLYDLCRDDEVNDLHNKINKRI